MDSKPITLWIQGIPHGFEVYYLETNGLVSVHQREHYVCFLQVSAISERNSCVVRKCKSFDKFDHEWTNW